MFGIASDQSAIESAIDHQSAIECAIDAWRAGDIVIEKITEYES